MMSFKDNEVVENEVVEVDTSEYDYFNEEPLGEEFDEYEEEHDYCD